MKKNLLLISVLLFTFMANAAEYRIGSATSNILGTTVAGAANGDVIILTDAGPYVNVWAEKDGDDYTKLTKNLTIKADDGVTPVIKYEVPFRSTEAATVKFIGIKFDGSSLNSHYDFYFRFYDTADSNLEFEDCEFANIGKFIFDVYTEKNANSLVIKNCNFHDISSRCVLVRGTIGEINISGSEFSNFTSYPIVDNYTNGNIGKIKIDGSEFFSNSKRLINGEAKSHADSCIITNCYFHDNAMSPVFFSASTIEGTETCDGVIVKNSTFINHDMSASDGSVIEVRNYGSAVASNIEVTIDHCTFYNNPTSADGYAAGVRSYKSTKVNISNCIFAHPTSYAKCGTYCYGGNVTNCLSHNLTSGTNGHHSGPTLTGNFTADPLFTDAANGDFTFPGNYVTDNVSPARGAATDGTDLGDPRWYTAAVYPSTDFASGYTFTAAKANISGNIEYNTTTATPYLRYADQSNPGTASWIITATRACDVTVTMNMVDNSAYSSGNGKHRFVVEVLDMNMAQKSVVQESSEVDENGRTFPRSYDMPGTLHIPAAGNYIIRLSNPRDHSRCGVASITLTYIYSGGNIVDIPVNPLPFADAILSANATRTLSPSPEIHFGSPNASQWAKWNISASAGMYDITVSFTGTNHGVYQLDIWDDEENNVFSASEGKGGSGSVSFESVFIPEDGNYVLQLANTNPGADGYLTSVVIEVSSEEDVFIISETETDGSYIEAKDGAKWKPLLARNFKAGMYNTICVPFDSYTSELTKIFGTGFELLELESTALVDGILDLNFSRVPADVDLLSGIPYLIKPTKDVTNPKFSKHTIHNYTNLNTVTRGVVSFIGSFVKTSVPAGANNLFLGSENKLYFSSAATPIKGMRAYFAVSAGAGAPTRARIVTQQNVVTEIDLVNGELPETFGSKVQKVIVNGQLILVKDGVEYNTLGVRVK